MRVERVVGTETEYAIAAEDGSPANPVSLSMAVVRAAADPERSHIHWDYGREDPVNDARTGRLPRAMASPGMLTDSPQSALMNVLAPNGGRIYVDHAHPEYSSPETTDPFQALAYDRAGDLLMSRAARCAGREGATHGVRLYKNNVDGKGACWGTHENYLMDRSVPFSRVVALMTIHFVTRQIYTGSGRVGLGVDGREPGFQIGQRADYLQTRVGLQTTFDRPIINTRDESHSTASTRRFHVIAGDANRMDLPQVLKLGTTSMLLGLLEDADTAGFDLDTLLGRLALNDPVSSLRTVSRDLSLNAPLVLESGRRETALQIQQDLFQAICRVGVILYGEDREGKPAWPGQVTGRLMKLWEAILDDLDRVRRADADERLGMSDQAGRLEWLMKWQLLESLRRRRSIHDWSDPRLAALDIEWARLDPGHDLPSRLGSRIQPVTSQPAVEDAADMGPDGTRAWFRSRILHDCPHIIRSMSWSRVVLEDPENDEGRPLIVDLTDPSGHTKADCPGVLEHSGDIARWLLKGEGRDLYC